MKTSHGFRAAYSVAGMMAGVLSLSGCMGSPTYGTGTPAMEQLGNDLASAVSLGGTQEKRDVKYNPRPGLVVAAQDRSLPPPQTSLASRENNPGWVESPEETRQRLRQEATDNENNPRYRSPLLAGKGKAGQMTESEKWEAFRQAKQNAEGTDVTQGRRRSLTDPPVQYRAVDSAELADLGEPELQKERRRKKEAQAAKQTSSWWKPFQ